MRYISSVSRDRHKPSEERCEVLLFHAEGWFQHNNIPPYLGHTHTYHQSVCSDCHDSFGTSAAVGKKTKWYKDSACHISDSLSPSRNVGPSKKSIGVIPRIRSNQATGQGSVVGSREVTSCWALVGYVHLCGEGSSIHGTRNELPQS